MASRHPPGRTLSLIDFPPTLLQSVRWCSGSKRNRDSLYVQTLLLFPFSENYVDVCFFCVCMALSLSLLPCGCAHQTNSRHHSTSASIAHEWSCWTWMAYTSSAQQKAALSLISRKLLSSVSLLRGGKPLQHWWSFHRFPRMYHWWQSSKLTSQTLPS